LENSFPAALRAVRKARGLSQEAFSDVSSRTYLSSLERGLKSPTLHKLMELCEVLEVHPMTLLTLAFASMSDSDELFALVNKELKAIKSAAEHLAAQDATADRGR